MELTDWQTRTKEKIQDFQILLDDLLTREYSPRELALLFLAALLCGALIKTVASSTLTIGFDDYKLSRDNRLVDLNVLEKQLFKDGGTIATASAATPHGETCSAENQ